MSLKEKLKNERVFLDGGLGTLLIANGLKSGEEPPLWNLTHPETVKKIHKDYLKAGADIITSNTFGVSSLKFSNVPELVSAAIRLAKEAASEFGGEKYVAYDVGPTGKLLKPMGDLDFEDAVSLFAEGMRAAEKAGADLVLIETMNDSYEAKAAVLAAKETTKLPIFVSCSYDESGKLMTGADPMAMVALLEGLGVSALGINCSLGPRDMLPVVEELLKYASVPVMVSPNAGLPRVENGKTIYDVDAEEFSSVMEQIAKMGACVLGGCCGTTPEYIEKTYQKCKNIDFSYPTFKNDTLVSSYTHAVSVGKAPTIIGERINPTGKSKFKEALRNGDIDYILKEAISQEESGAHILDVNVGLPEIDEAETLKKAVGAIQGISTLPLQIDSVDAVAMEKALRIYNGKPMINSVSGKEESMSHILPLAAKYGGVLIALSIDEGGIPETAEGRCKIIQKIIERAKEYGIDKKNIVADPLAMTISANPESAKITLDALKLIKNKLKIATSLGVSNISFGLPKRDIVNSAFLTMAFASGLDCAILNPLSAEMMKSYHAYNALCANDKMCADYIDFANRVELDAGLKEKQEKQKNDSTADLISCIEKGMCEAAKKQTEILLALKEPLAIINEHIIPALDTVGKGFEEKKVFLPQLLMSAEAAKSAFDVLRRSMEKTIAENGRKIVIATVKGDIHDIGKNIVKVLLQNYDFSVIDLGKDVSPEEILRAVKESGARLVALSALMTTTVPAMSDTIALLKKECPSVKTIVGGAVLTQEYADMIGADFYSKDAMQAVRFAEKFFHN